MSPLQRALVGVVVIVGSLTVGYLARKSGRLNEDQAGGINRAVLTWMSPPVVALVMWALRPPGLQVLALPLIFTVVSMLMALPAVWLARRLLADRRSRGPWVVCAMFSNTGMTYGALLCYILLGVQGAALGTIFALPFLPLVFSVGFYVLDHYGGEVRRTPFQSLAGTLRHGYSRNPMIGVAAGLGLLLAGVPFPSFGEGIIDVAVPLEAGLQLFAIGATLHFSLIADYLRPVAVMHGLKFLLAPLLGLGLAWLLGLWGAEDRDLLRVVFIQTATPVAITAVVLTQAARLNVGLANSLWVTTNLFAVLWAPLLLFVAGRL